MKDMLTDQRFRYWPVNSIAYYALRNSIVNASLATWYNYIHKLGWERPKFPKKTKYGIGIRANRPNQVWCTDITYLPMRGGYMYLVAIMDWYSRRILSWELSMIRSRRPLSIGTSSGTLVRAMKFFNRSPPNLSIKSSSRDRKKRDDPGSPCRAALFVCISGQRR